MELIDLFSGFDLDNVKDSDLKTIAKGLTVTIIRSPLEKKCPADLNTARAIVSETMNKYLHDIINGGVFTKAKMISTVTFNIPRGKDLTAEWTDIDVKPMVALVSDMHIHHMKEEDYKEIADEFARLAVMTGKFPELFDSTLSQNQAMMSDCASKIYTALKMALKEKDFLMEQASESAQKH